MLAVVGLLLAASVATPATPVRPRVHLNVDVERDVVVAREDLEAAARVVADIWMPAIDVTVSLPGTPRLAGATDVLRVVVTDRRLSRRDSGLAWIEFVDGEPLHELTVSIGAVHDLLAQGSWRGRTFAALPPAATRTFVQRAMGRAIAHEIGHYLLRSRAHEGRGLMRSVFSIDDIMSPKTALGPAVRAYASRAGHQPDVAVNDAGNRPN